MAGCLRPKGISIRCDVLANQVNRFNFRQEQLADKVHIFDIAAQLFFRV